MFSLTRKTDYALVALTAMVHERHLVSARGLADRLNLPLPVLRNILKHLTQVGLINSTRGQQGGYQLARTAEEISLVDLIEAMEGPLRLTMCCRPSGDPDRDKCDLEGSCMIKRPVQRVHALMQQFLSRISLAQLAHDEVPREVQVLVGGDVCQCQSHTNGSTTTKD